jgi:L-lactate dehydrogenase complex protein LldG
MSDPLIELVRRALGRTTPLTAPPTPPTIPDSVARLVPKDADLVEFFAKSAIAANFRLEKIPQSEICPNLIEFLRLNQCKNIGIPNSVLFDRIGIPKALQEAGNTVHLWDQSTLDAAYDLDCGITDVFAVVAETGSLAIRPSPTHGRAISLVPPMHIAIVEPSNILPDLIDLMEKIREAHPAITLITGPSKTADIEGALVTGVHGPGIVQIYLLSD